MANWESIKTEYITTDTSYRKLGEKYGVNYKVIAERGKAEGWSQMRSQHKDKTLTKIIETIEGKKVDRAERLQSVTDKLLDKVELLLDDLERVGSGSLRNISATLRDIKEIQRSELDNQEQLARIANLKKQTEKDDKDTAITVTLEGELSEYAE